MRTARPDLSPQVMKLGRRGSQRFLQCLGELVQMAPHDVQVQPYVLGFVGLQSGQIPKVLN